MVYWIFSAMPINVIEFNPEEVSLSDLMRRCQATGTRLSNADAALRQGFTLCGEALALLNLPLNQMEVWATSKGPRNYFVRAVWTNNMGQVSLQLLWVMKNSSGQNGTEGVLTAVHGADLILASRALESLMGRAMAMADEHCQKAEECLGALCEVEPLSKNPSGFSVSWKP